MVKNRFYCDDETEYRGYGIFDLSKSNKTKEDFYDEEDGYLLWAFGNYLIDKTDSMLTGKEVVDLLNGLLADNVKLHQQLKNQK